MRPLAPVLALALATLAAGQARAQDSGVTLYGIVGPIVENVGGSGATTSRPAGATDLVPEAAYGASAAPRRNRMGSNISNLGVRGRESLGGGWTAFFQIETTFLVEDLRDFPLPDRNSAIGVDGPLGRFLVGQWDTPYKSSTIALGPMRIGITQDFPTLMGNPGFAVPVLTTQGGRIGGKADAAFDRRQGNSVQYWSPRFAELQLRLLWSVGERKAAVTAGGPVISPEVLGGWLGWSRGAHSFGLSWERHDDYFGLTQVAGSAAGTATNAASRDEAFKIHGNTMIGPVRVAAFAERIEYRNRDSAPGAIDRYQRDAVNVLVQPVAGPHRPWVAWTMARAGSCGRTAGAPCSTAGLGARQLTAGWLYAFSRRTEAYVVAQWLDNESSSTYGLLPAIGTSVPGARYTGAGLGLTHFF